MGCGRKPESPEKTQANTGRTRKLHTDSGPSWELSFPYQCHSELTLDKSFQDVPCAPCLWEVAACCQQVHERREKSPDCAATVVSMVNATVCQAAWGGDAAIPGPLRSSLRKGPWQVLWAPLSDLKTEGLEGMFALPCPGSGDLSPGGSQADPGPEEAVGWPEP